MKLHFSPRTLAFAFALAAPAMPLLAVAQGAVVTIDCAAPKLPSQQDVARVTGVDNFSQAYLVRSRLLVDTQRACQRGAGKIQIVLAVPEANARRVASR